MTNHSFGRRELDEFLDSAADRLPGRWVLVGDAAAAWFLDDRVTRDIDLVAMEDTHEQRIALLDLAAERGLPLEAVNSAAGWFLRRIAGWENELEPLRSGHGTTLRPSPTLFLLTKIRRLAESDLADCLALIEAAEANGWALDGARVLEALDALPAADGNLKHRRDALRERLRR